jgi:hypothetical protein
MSKFKTIIEILAFGFQVLKDFKVSKKYLIGT